MDRYNSPLAVKARSRNWTKARLVGFSFAIKAGTVTNEEIEIFKQITSLKMKLLDSWDENSRVLGFKTRPKVNRFRDEDDFVDGLNRS